MYFSKYLKEMGHNPIVVTVDEKYASYNQKDYSLLKEIDNIELSRKVSINLSQSEEVNELINTLKNYLKWSY